MNKILTILILGAISGKIECLQDYTTFSEGPCDAVPFKPAVANRATMDSFRHISGGGKFLMYMLASLALPNYNETRDDQLYYEACYTRNCTTTRDSMSNVFGFGKSVISFNVQGNPVGTYVDADPVDPQVLQRLGRVNETIVYTDHRTFSFSVICFPQLNLRTWAVNSLIPDITEDNVKVIENYATSLGFKRDNFVFLKYNDCRGGAPIFQVSL